jgi:geranylgeranylglycerol-phosphate geranylgeranyltransferase
MVTVSRITAFFRLARFGHAVMFAFSVYIAMAIAVGGLPELGTRTALVLAVPVFSEIFAFTLNDLLDMETDKRNSKKRPLVTGEVSRGEAAVMAGLSFVLALVAAYLCGPALFAIAVVANVLAALYNIWLKDLPALGNMYIACSMAIPFIFGSYAAVNAPTMQNAVLAALAFVAGLGREIAKSAEDMKGDVSARKSRTLPVVIGWKNSIKIAGVLYILFTAFSLLPYYLGFHAGYGLALVLVADAVFLYCATIMVFYNVSMDFLSTSVRATLGAIAIGLGGLFLSALGI